MIMYIITGTYEESRLMGMELLGIFWIRSKMEIIWNEYKNMTN